MSLCAHWTKETFKKLGFYSLSTLGIISMFDLFIGIPKGLLFDIYVAFWLILLFQSFVGFYLYLLKSVIEKPTIIRLEQNDVEVLRSFFRRLESDDVVAIDLNGKSIEFIRKTKEVGSA